MCSLCPAIALQCVNFTPVVVRVKQSVRMGNDGMDIHVALLSIVSLKVWESGAQVNWEERS